MDWPEFRQSLNNDLPPQGMTIALEALWFAGKENWESAHDLVNDIESKDAMLVHAYLHRIEPDLTNAAYWYSRSGTQIPDLSPEVEWETLVRKFLGET